MKKIIILVLCCGVFVSMVGCGGNTASPPADDSPPTMVLETVIKETPTETIPLTTAVKPTEKEKEPVLTERNAQAIDPTTTSTTATVEPTEETKPTETTKTTVTNTSEEKVVSQAEEIVTSITSQHTEYETTVNELTKETVPELESLHPEFDIQYWISFAKEYAVSVGLTLDSTAVDCWDNPIGAGVHSIYLERDIKSRLNRYAKDEDITDVWIWTETTGNKCYDIYIGYA